MSRSLTKVVALLALFAAVACAALRSAERDPASTIKAVQTQYQKSKAAADAVCAALPDAEQAGLVKGDAAKEAERFCSDLAKAEGGK